MSPDVEKILCPTDDLQPPPYPKRMELARAVEIVILPVGGEGVPDILRYVKPLVFMEGDYCDIVAAGNGRNRTLSGLANQSKDRGSERA